MSSDAIITSLKENIAALTKEKKNLSESCRSLDERVKGYVSKIAELEKRISDLEINDDGAIYNELETFKGLYERGKEIQRKLSEKLAVAWSKQPTKIAEYVAELEAKVARLESACEVEASNG